MREEGVVALLLLNGHLKTCSGLSRYRDVNLVPTSSLADDLVSVPSSWVIADFIFLERLEFLDSH